MNDIDNSDELVLDILKVIASSFNASPVDAAEFYKKSMDAYHNVIDKE